LTSATLTLSSIVSQSREPVAADVDQTVVMMSIARGNYYSVDGVGARIWKLLQTPRSVAALCEVLVEEYAVEPEQCRADVLAFLARLRDEGLVEVSSESTGATRAPSER